MNREDIIRMAEEAGFSAYHLAVLDQGIYRFANSVAAAEREACAKVVEADGLARGKTGLVLLKNAERIRARGQR